MTGGRPRRASNPTLSAILAELEAANVPVLSVEINKHVKVRFTVKGTPHLYVCPTSPSDSRRGTINALADIRRMIGRDHLPAKSTRPPPKHKPPRPKPVPALDGFGLMRDWQAELAKKFGHK